LSLQLFFTVYNSCHGANLGFYFGNPTQSSLTGKTKTALSNFTAGMASLKGNAVTA